MVFTPDNLFRKLPHRVHNPDVSGSNPNIINYPNISPLSKEIVKSVTHHLVFLFFYQLSRIVMRRLYGPCSLLAATFMRSYG